MYLQGGHEEDAMGRWKFIFNVVTPQAHTTGLLSNLLIPQL